MPQKALKTLKTTPQHKHLNKRHQPTLRLPSTPIILTTHATHTISIPLAQALISPSEVAHAVARTNSAVEEGDVAAVHLHGIEEAIPLLVAGKDATST